MQIRRYWIADTQNITELLLRYEHNNVYDEYGNKKTVRIREEMAVAFQHEIDHLNGILFPDRIDPKNPNIIPSKKNGCLINALEAPTNLLISISLLLD